MYALERGGEWREGIGTFYEKMKKAQDCGKVFPNLRIYTETCLSEPPRPGGAYPGSPGLVHKILQKLCRNHRFFLCDVDPGVCTDLIGYFPQWNQVTIYRGNGFEYLQKVEEASLVLIDPSYMETEEDRWSVLAALELLDNQKISFVCWTPRMGPAVPEDGEASFSRFEKEVAGRFASVPVRWRDRESKIVCEQEKKVLWGCGVTTSHDLEAVARKTLGELEQIMDWGERSGNA
jgi:hypothetical protein